MWIMPSVSSDFPACRPGADHAREPGSIIRIIRQRIGNQPAGKGLTTFLNPFSYLQLRETPDLLAGFDRICIDGALLVSALRLAGFRDVKRVSFDYGSIAGEFLDRCSAEGRSVFFIGTTPDLNPLAVRVIRKKHNGLEIAGSRHGYFNSVSERSRFIRALRDVSPDVVVAGLGTRLQEKFLLDLRASGWEGLGISCGGFFHQIASKGREYYPALVNRLGIRSVYRAINEKQIRRRLLIHYPRFPRRFLNDVADERSAAAA
jgi:N-acetylglucosaminyldiphosphoundecaprenol N-acetyl-beta-D-mannosaminyltransferase